jgi:hypothetical protein
MNDFKVMNDRKRKPFSKGVAILFGVLLIGVGIYTGSIFGIVFGPIIIWASLFIKYTIVNEEGIVVHYDAKIFKYKEEWPFDKVSNIHREATKDLEYSMLHFTKGAMSKRLVFTSQDAQAIIDLAKERNSNIHFDEAR